MIVSGILGDHSTAAHSHVSALFIFSFLKRSTSFFKLLNPHSNSICVRNSVVAWNNEPLLKDLCVTIMNLLFPKYAVIATKMGSTTDHNNTTLSQLPPITAGLVLLTNCLVRSAALFTLDELTEDNSLVSIKQYI